MDVFTNIYQAPQTPRVYAWNSNLPKLDTIEGGAQNITQMGFMGYTIMDGIDFFEGIASGMFGEDVRQTWGECFVDIPEEALDGFN